MDLVQKLLCFLPIILCFVLEIRGYNLDVRIPVVKQGEMGSYFGFSVTGHTMSTRTPRAADGYKDSIMLVGAPKFDTPEQGLKKPAGAVFKCPLSSNTDDCERVINDVTGNIGNEDKSDQWLGVRVDSQGAGGFVGVCAHRYKEVSDSEISGLGKCWQLNNDLTGYAAIGSHEWKPCAGKTTGKRFYGYCQAGTGLHMVPESKASGNWWLAGTPGKGDWRGGFFGITDLDEDTLDYFNLNSALVDVIDEKTAQKNLDSLGVNLNSYLGFSVTAGIFSDDGLQVVAGAPRSENIGAVVIFKPRRSGEVEKQHVMPGYSMTESYGYSVCAADLNGDGYDDLIIGAPLYYDRNTDAGGRVYIYLNENKTADFSGVTPITLTGSLDSMFGISVINLGDLDLDGKQDIAIGSPYENNGEGAVYIYHGAADGIKQPPTQKITPADLPDDLPIDRLFNYTFGYSLAGGIDLDGNDYPELVIGAFQTDTVVTLRSRPIINITAYLRTDEKSLDANETNCEYNSRPALCFEVFVVMRQDTRSESFVSQTVDVKFSIDTESERLEELHKPPRAIFEKTGKYEVKDQVMTLNAKWDEVDTISERYKVVIQKGFTDIYRPIPFRLKYELVQDIPEVPNPGDELPNMRDYPILEGAIDGKVVQDEPSLTIDFAKECAKDDGVCITDLSMKVETNFEDKENPVLKVGVQKEVEIVIELQNLNEAAYDAQIVIAFPEVLHFNVFGDMATQKCSIPDTEPTLITCKLGNPYPTTTKPDKFTFKFDASGVPSDIDNITISINATAANEDSNTEDNSFSITADVTGITDIQLNVEKPPQYQYSGKVRGESAIDFEDEIGMLVKHTWKVFNNGPGMVESSMVTIYFPYESSIGKWLLYMTDPPRVLKDKGTCEIDPERINPAGFKKRVVPEEEEEDDYTGISEVDEPVTDLPTTVDIVKDNGGKKTPDEETGETDRNSRRRRDADQLQFRRKRESNEESVKPENSIDLDCMDEDNPDRPKCFQFTCTLDALYDGDEAEIELRSRLWSSTFIEEFLEYEQVKVFSYGKVEMLGGKKLTQEPKDLNNDDNTLITDVRRHLDFIPPARVKWWIILLAVLGGILLLIILILILLKCGFFKRKHREYKYAAVEQVTAEKGKTDRRIYYDDSYMDEDGKNKES
ncbi:integrin alpha-6-like isoform X2 [Amphiura filiformis]|uniref:integrin alpha-6-like isoform X2 n=1 Tax=Amphiura filiformis TaxID=82378 RepID=UPI003B20D3F5